MFRASFSWRRRAIAIVTLIAPWALMADSPAPSRLARTIDLTRFRMTFAEDFDTLSVSPWGPKSRWIAHTPWAGDFGDAKFLDPAADGPFATRNGLLTITMRRREGKWTSGLLSAADAESRGFTQSGGYFEMRAKLPSGRGVWPAFWLGSNAPGGTSKPEIDVFEYYGHEPGAYMVTTHVWRDGRSEAGEAIPVTVPAGSLEREFHRYGVAIDPREIVFYLDRREVAHQPSRPEYLMPVYPMVNLAAGGGWPIDGMPDPSVLTVDYIRAYVPR